MNKGGGSKDMRKRRGACMAALGKVDLLWLHSGCPTELNMEVFNAAITRRLMDVWNQHNLRTRQSNNLTPSNLMTGNHAGDDYAHQ